MGKEELHVEIERPSVEVSTRFWPLGGRIAGGFDVFPFFLSPDVSTCGGGGKVFFFFFFFFVFSHGTTRTRCIGNRGRKRRSRSRGRGRSTRTRTRTRTRTKGKYSDRSGDLFIDPRLDFCRVHLLCSHPPSHANHQHRIYQVQAQVCSRLHGRYLVPTTWIYCGVAKRICLCPRHPGQSTGSTRDHQGHVGIGGGGSEFSLSRLSLFRIGHHRARTHQIDGADANVYGLVFGSPSTFPHRFRSRSFHE
mmetsp:Transcript_30133/g.77798  ORF Transcript_30133/g.77798 Transcript_30133/m.77798 type:complete len:249 (-) Transcript_30133:4569-5315(-)